MQPTLISESTVKESTRTNKGLLCIQLLAVAFITIAHRIPSWFALTILSALATTTVFTLRRWIPTIGFRYSIGLGALTSIASLCMGEQNSLKVLLCLNQFVLVSTSLLAGLGLFNKTGLRKSEICQARMLVDGPKLAMRSFAIGSVIGIPWAVLNLPPVHGISHDTWVTSWWHTFSALAPSISEEAWTKVFLMPLLFTFLKNLMGRKSALTIAQLVITYWFASLHFKTPGNTIGAAILGTLFGLPLLYLSYYVNLETAIGFHFIIDFCRYLHAFIYR